MKTWLGLDISDEKYLIFATISSGSGSKPFDIHSLQYQLNNPEVVRSNSQLKAGVSIAVAGNNSISYVIPNFNPENIESEKASWGVTDDQNFDYLMIPGTRSALLVSMHKSAVRELVLSTDNYFPNKSELRISHWSDLLVYAYLRSYPNATGSVALVHVTSDAIYLLALNRKKLIWVDSFSLTDNSAETGDYSYARLFALLEQVKVACDISQFDLFLLSGSCDANDRLQLQSYASQVELFSPFFNDQLFDTKNLSDDEYQFLTNNAHRFVLTFAAAAAAIEGIGTNLASNERSSNLKREIPRRPVITNAMRLAAIKAVADKAADRLIPFVSARSGLVIFSLLAALLITAFRYGDYYLLINSLNDQLTAEQNRAASLADVRAKVEDYKARIAAINNRVRIINDLRRRELSVRTSLDQLDQRIPRGVIFSLLEIRETEIKVDGYAADRSEVVEFVNRLGRSFGLFDEVLPVYEDKITEVGRYSITCKYVGNVPLNDKPLPEIPTNQLLASDKE
ncbi:MAG: PilN domain-containing protein [Acidobacteriota bacterium]